MTSWELRQPPAFQTEPLVSPHDPARYVAISGLLKDLLRAEAKLRLQQPPVCNHIGDLR